jgi:hypothetical protein
MRRTVVFFLVVATCLSALPQKPLTNDDIIKMVKGGLSDDVILLAIESQPSDFDISAQALIELKQQGASKAVLDKILEVAAANRRGGAPAKTVSTPVQSQPPSQAESQVAPPLSGPIQSLSPADEERMRTLVEHAVSQSRHLLAQPLEQNLHELLDQGLSGGDLPAPFKASFVALFTPYRQALHQFLDQEAARLRQQLKKPSGPRSNLKGPSPFLRPVLWTGGKIFPTEAGPDPIVASRGRSAPRPYRDPSLWLLNSQPACGEKSTSHSESKGYVTETITFVEWVDTPDAIASTGDAVTEMDITADPTVPVQGTKSGKVSSKLVGGACVDRCPTADGKVAGKSEDGWDRTAEVTATTGAVSGGRELYQQDVTAEGHVGDDARLREVVVQADFNYEKRVGSELTIQRWRGTATFDPHVPETQVPLQLTGCWGNQGDLPIAKCSAWGTTAYVGKLQDAYLRAERKWNLEQEPGTAYTPGSRCVIAKFTPPTKTVKGSPHQKVQLKAELITVKGNQPTRGAFDEFRQITGDGDTQANGTRTSPEKPAQLIYTAPSKQWPLDDPPGFGVYRATSRAGALDPGDNGVGYTPDDWQWFLAPGLTLSIHERTEVQFMIVSMLSEVTFPMDLNVNEQGQVVGQAAVQREARQQSPCVGEDRWMEQWHASGTLDKKTDTLTLKLWFEASPRQGSFTCPGPKTVPHTAPGFRSDAFPTPLNHFTLSDKEGAKQHFVIPFSPAAKHTIDVTVASGLSGAAAK